MRRTTASIRRTTGLVVMTAALASQALAESEPFDDPNSAWPDVSPTGDLRLRGLLDSSRDLGPDPLPQVTVPVLARAGFEVTLLDRYSAVTQAGAAGSLGRDTTEPVLFLDQLFFETRQPWSAGVLRFRFGRQPIDLFDGRLVGQDYFRDRPLRLDALRLSLLGSGIEADAFVALLGARFDPGIASGADDLFVALSVLYRLGSVLLLEGHVHGRMAELGQSDPEASRVATLGIHADLTPAEFLQASTTASYQTGQQNGQEQSAYELGAHVSLSLPSPGCPSLVLGVDYASGDSDPGDASSTRFDAPLAPGHPRFGLADLLAPSNAVDLFVSGVLVAEGSRLALSLHRLALATPGDAWRDPSGTERMPGNAGQDPLLGHELDLDGRLVLARQVALEFLFTVFWPDGGALAAGTRTSQRLLIGVGFEY